MCGYFLFPDFFQLVWFITLLSLTGKHSFKKDDSLTKVMLVPPKQRMRIVHFDPRTQEDAFSVSLEGLKGVRSPLLLHTTNQSHLIALVEYQHSCSRIGSGPGRPEKKGTFFEMAYYLNPLFHISVVRLGIN